LILGYKLVKHNSVKNKEGSCNKEVNIIVLYCFTI